MTCEKINELVLMRSDLFYHSLPTRSVDVVGPNTLLIQATHDEVVIHPDVLAMLMKCRCQG